MPRLSAFEFPDLSIFSKALNVEIKKVTKQRITIPLSTMMSIFFILFFQFKVKEN
jgi:hypothetical protein